MESLMQKIIECQIKASETWALLSHDNRVSDYYEDCEPPSAHCFRLTVKNSNLPFLKVSIAHPPDTDLDSYEIALIGEDNHIIYNDELGMSDIYRFHSYDSMVEGIIRLANNLSVDGVDYEDLDEGIIVE